MKHVKMVVRRAFAAAYAVFFDLDELPLNMKQKFYKKKMFFSCAGTKLGGEAIKLQNFIFKDYS